MKHLIRFALFPLLLLTFASISNAQSTSTADVRAAVSEACQAASTLRGLAPAACGFGGIERRHITGDISEYSFTLKLGSGEHDVVKIHHVGAEGGFGGFGTDTLSRLGSADVSSHVVQLQPTEARAIDFGHADLFLADNAREMVWSPIYNWVVSH